MSKKSLVRNIIEGDELKQKIQSGVDKIYTVARASYGVNSGNVMIEHRFGEPLVSHDGVTNIGKLVVEDSVENMAISLVRQASERTNRDAGDSTTLTTLLTKLAYDYWSERGLSPRKVQSEIMATVDVVREYIAKHKIAIDDDLLQGVSRVSAGDEALGDLVFDAVKTAGVNGGITVIESPSAQISSEKIDGFTFKKGLKAIALANDIQSIKSRYDSPAIVVMSRIISKNDDILPIIEQLLIAEKKNIVIIGDVSGQALETIIANKLEGRLDIAIVEPESINREVFLSDVAAYASTTVFSDITGNFDVEKHVGTAESVHITVSETTINGCKNTAALEEYKKDITDTIRLERLNGVTVKISVGAPTQVERQELKLRIDDAVCAAKTALEHGVVPGGGVFLRDMQADMFPDSDISYFATPFMLLVGDSDEAMKLYEKGSGVDIYHDKNVPNMVEARIVDSAKAVEEAVVNAHSVAAQLISINTALPFAEDMD